MAVGFYAAEKKLKNSENGATPNPRNVNCQTGLFL